MTPSPKSITIPWAVFLSALALVTGASSAAAGGAVTRDGDLSALSARVEVVAEQADRHLTDALASRDIKLDAVLEELRAIRVELRDMRAEDRAAR